MSKASHGSSISPWIRQWLRSSFADRFFLVFTSPWAIGYWVLVGLIVAGTGSAASYALMLVPHGLWALDGIVDRFSTGGEIQEFIARDDVALATRAEYVGGHTQLPHGRFAYVMLRGTKQNPMLTIAFPGQTESEMFDVPILDVAKTKDEKYEEESIAESMLTSLTEKVGSGVFNKERVQLNVKYQGPGGRKNEVELTNFFHGNDEVRNWRNYLVCAQAEADTGATPHAPWKTLKEEPEPKPEEVTDDDASGDGSKVQPARRAFERR